MQYFTSTSALARTLLASAIVASSIGVPTPGAAVPVHEDQGLVSLTYEEQAPGRFSGPAHQESFVSQTVATSAFVVASALMGTLINQTRTRPNDIGSMLDGYGLLTGGAIPLWSVSTASSEESKGEATTAPPVVADPAVVSGPSNVAVSGATSVEDEMIRWALQRFEVAGLELPPLAVSFHNDKADCRGFVGYYSETEERIDICTRAETSSRRRTVLHELGHAWSFSRMTGGQIDEFVAHRGLTAWKDNDVAWWQMGQEQAAEIVAWGLQDSDEYQSIWLHLETCSDLAAGFELLTGIPPLNNNTQYCK